VDILTKVRHLESTLARRFDHAARKLTRSGAREPLEILHAIVDVVDREIQPSGRGKHVFPFNSIQVLVLAPTREIRDRFQTVLAGDAGLRGRIDHKLRSAGCAGADVAMTISYVGRAQPSWREPEFHVKFARVETTRLEDATAPPDRGRLDVTVVRGAAERRSYSFAAERIDLGRCVEVKDSRGRLIRINDLAFVEGSGEVNESISRQHAHITHHLGSGEFRLFDDGSAHGTHIVRQGRRVTVPRGSRGARLRSGDEIALGDARLRIKINS
jgi:hypothetical protein